MSEAARAEGISPSTLYHWRARPGLKGLFDRAIKKGHERRVIASLEKKRRFKDSLAYQEARRRVLKRDRGICQICGEKGSEVHHIVPICVNPDLALEVKNMVVLCLDCHRSQHPELPDEMFYKRWGIKNADRKRTMAKLRK